jgi:hypothetical protein
MLRVCALGWPAGLNLMKKTCGGLFRKWRAILEAERGLWGVRCLASGRFWRSPGLREATGTAEEEDWGTVVRRYANEREVEDAHSLALKTGCASRCAVRTADFAFMVVFMAVQCDMCEGRCAAIVGCGAEVSGVESDGEQAGIGSPFSERRR